MYGSPRAKGGTTQNLNTSVSSISWRFTPALPGAPSPPSRGLYGLDALQRRGLPLCLAASQQELAPRSTH